MLQENGLHRGHVVISLGYAHGQDLATPSARSGVAMWAVFIRPGM